MATFSANPFATCASTPNAFALPARRPPPFTWSAKFPAPYLTAGRLPLKCSADSGKGSVRSPPDTGWPR